MPKPKVFKHMEMIYQVTSWDNFQSTITAINLRLQPLAKVTLLQTQIYKWYRPAMWMAHRKSIPIAVQITHVVFIFSWENGIFFIYRHVVNRLTTINIQLFI